MTTKRIEGVVAVLAHLTTRLKIRRQLHTPKAKRKTFVLLLPQEMALLKFGSDSNLSGRRPFKLARAGSHASSL
jgi:hypothetical protein